MSYRIKIPYEQKLKVVEGYLNGELGLSATCRMLGIDNQSLLDWVMIYQTEGPSGLKPVIHPKFYPIELKINAVKDYLEGLGSLSEICRKYKIRWATSLRSWIKVYTSNGEFRPQVIQGGTNLSVTKTRKTTYEERISAVKFCLENGKDYVGTAKEYKVGYYQIKQWVSKFEEFGPDGLEDRRGKRIISQKPRNELEELRIQLEQEKHKNYLLTVENELLKKVNELERRNASLK